MRHNRDKMLCKLLGPDAPQTFRGRPKAALLNLSADTNNNFRQKVRYKGGSWSAISEGPDNLWTPLISNRTLRDESAFRHCSNMQKPKITIQIQEVTETIRSGASDFELMDRYGLSAQGVKRLFEKLVAAGEITESELDTRISLSRQSDIVSLTPTFFPKPKQTRIKAGKAVKDIRSGMGDLELMQKYNLSASGLQSLFGKLIKAGAIGESELTERRHALRWAELAFPDKRRIAVDSPEQEIKYEDTSPETFFSRHQQKFAILTGILIGFGVACLAFVTLVGFKNIRQLIYPPPPSPAQQIETQKAQQADHFIDALKAINTGKSEPQNRNEGDIYSRCLKDCDSEFSGPDADASLRANCRRECTQEHGPRVKRMRELYYK
jgi:hypothetical protein